MTIDARIAKLEAARAPGDGGPDLTALTDGELAWLHAVAVRMRRFQNPVSFWTRLDAASRTPLDVIAAKLFGGE